MENEFDNLLNEVSISLKRLIYYSVNDSYLTDDLYQDTIIQAWRKFNTLNDLSKFKQWIFQIARNKVKDYYRSKVKDPIIIELDETICNKYIRDIESIKIEIAKEKVYDIFNKLSAEYKEILEMYYIEELSITDLSNTFQISIGTVKSRLFNARKKFKETYELLYKKEESSMHLFPKKEPNINIMPLNEKFTVDYCELHWWFMKPIKDYNCKWAMYDYPEKDLTNVTKMEYISDAKIHGIDCIEFSSVNYNFENNCWDNFNSLLYARLTDTHVQWVAQYENQSKLKKFKSFLDDDFLKDMGSIDPIKGDERIIKDEGKYILKEDGSIITNDKHNKANGFGFYKVIINNKEYKCIRVLDVTNDMLIEAYISNFGETILCRRYNATNWGIDSDYTKIPWEEKFPNNQKLIIDGITYVHWYDCLTEKVF